ncbi:general stress protein [Bacillus glycinifermentans]|uniref:DNA starvation/stationary phase protection protein n=1 Tax=Bacillus glycinifermentans TaxID=1664069 RepID=A0A0J6EF98_9BACI|nr:DNA starvation/stationary phase protection protein [Bacillus glycinifermentans]ATH93079.1 DNA starvation/stationary phase protection protein [Bacillus glycinifermentans]KMM56238.1 general stress protein [Bacillus glycinifermentans]KRT94322.1 DNA starvation/stationary phase protection protein [Bacillus glycinifermentans]MEC0485851.1 DNA starvation/stationary phase protection protein [Bacillus glycinifermentans]MEC0495677.1 DNA starvation/stationary phase protection protein [Bacillus glycinif
MISQQLKQQNPVLENSINTNLSNWFILYTKLHRFHWYVKGPQFFTLHEKFEELYNHAAETADVVAERLLAIGGQPLASMKEYLDHGTISEASTEKTASDMVSALVSDYRQIRKEIEHIIELAEEKSDNATADLYIGLTEEIDKQIWMLSSFLGE